MTEQPRHSLPSYGRLDLPANRQEPLTITPSAPVADQPATTKSVAAQWFEVVQKVPLQQREYLAEIDARDLAPDDRLRAAREFDAKVLDVAEAAFKQQAADYDSAYRDTLSAAAANMTEDGAARIRDRALDRLANADSPVTAAQRLIETAPNAEELAVILQEVPSWLESRGHPTGWVPEVVAGNVPQVAEALTKREKARQTAVIGKQTIEQVRRGIDTATPASHLMPADKLSQYGPEG
jgi:hypothetical protein